MDKIKELYMKYKEVVNYLVVGVLTTVVSIGSYMIMTHTFLNPDDGFQLQVANVLSWILAVAFAYVTNRKFVFESKDPNMFAEIVKFTSSRVATLLMEMAVMFLLVTVLHFNSDISKVVAQVMVIVANYVLSKFLVFNGKEKTKA